MRRAAAWVLAGALVLVLVACGADEAAQVDVTLTVGDAIAADIVTVAVTAYGGADVDSDEIDPTGGHVYGESSPLELPLRIAVAPLGGDPARAFRIRIAARDAAGVVLAAAIVEGGFTADARRAVFVDLPDCCLETELCSKTRVPAGGEATDITATPECTPPDEPTAAPTDAVQIIAPDNGAATGSIHAPASLSPRFAWEPVPGASRYELALSDGCSIEAFPDCAFTDARVETTGATELVLTEPLAASTTAPVGARWVYRVRGCNAAGCAPWSSTRFIDVGRLANDADGDGYSDLVVGAPGRADGGAAYLFPGSASGPDLAPSAWSEVPPEDGASEIGAAVAVGDLDGDGRAEIVAGAPGGAGGGVVYVFGAATGASGFALVATLRAPASDAVLRFGAALAVADFDGDGRRDVLIGAPGDGTTRTDGAYFVRWTADGPGVVARLGIEGADALGIGVRVTNLGDVDGDGTDDALFAAGDIGSTTDAPVAYLYLGQREGVPAAPALVLSSGAGRLGDGFGAAAARVGDLDGDGRAEIAVGADMMDDDSGGVIVYWSTTYPERFGTVGLLVRGADRGARFGASLAGIADLDGDGRGELLVGASHASGDAGTVEVRLSSAPESAGGPTLGPDAPQAGALFGAALSSVGDVDGDGLADVVVAAPGWDSGAGRVFIFPGGAEGFGDAIPVPAPGGGDGGAFGRLPTIP